MKIPRASLVSSSLFTVTILLFGACLQSHAVPVFVYNSFGPGNTHTTTAWAVGGATSPSFYRGQAEFFVPGISGNLSGVQLATRTISGSTLSNFFIAQDDGTGLPGTILESFLNVQNVNGVLSIASTIQPLLQAGQKYWLCDEPSADNSYNGWYENNQGFVDGFGYERNEWGWQFLSGSVPPSGTFSVSVTPVPEPSVAALALFGTGLLARRFRIRRKEQSLNTI